MLSPAPSVLALTIRVVPTGLPALLITPVHFAPPTPLALQPTRHAAIGMAAVARAADVEQTPTSAVTAKTLSENDFPTARAHSTVLSLDSTPAIVASFKPLVARASFAGGGPPKTPVALDDRGFFFARTISRKRVARLTARMMTGPAQLDGWSENCGFTGSATLPIVEAATHLAAHSARCFFERRCSVTTRAERSPKSPVTLHVRQLKAGDAIRVLELRRSSEGLGPCRNLDRLQRYLKSDLNAYPESAQNALTQLVSQLALRSASEEPILVVADGANVMPRPPEPQEHLTHGPKHDGKEHAAPRLPEVTVRSFRSSLRRRPGRSRACSRIDRMTPKLVLTSRSS